MTDQPHVVDRLKRRLQEARSLGFKVRIEALDGQQATWCEIAGIPTLFVDAAQTAAEQLQQLNESLAGYQHFRGTPAAYERSTSAGGANPNGATQPVSKPVDRAA